MNDKTNYWFEDHPYDDSFPLGGFSIAVSVFITLFGVFILQNTNVSSPTLWDSFVIPNIWAILVLMVFFAETYIILGSKLASRKFKNIWGAMGAKFATYPAAFFLSCGLVGIIANIYNDPLSWLIAVGSVTGVVVVVLLVAWINKSIVNGMVK